MAVIDQLSLIVPLFLIVVIELAGVGRQYNLEKIAKNDLKSLGFLPERQVRFIKKIDPHLGPFSYIHNVNVLFLWYLLVLLVYSPQEGIIQPLIGFVVGVWVIQPVLEVEEYTEILMGLRTEVWSIYYHMFITLALFAALIHARSSYLPRIPEDIIPWLILSTVLVLLLAIVYLRLLHRELEKI